MSVEKFEAWPKTPRLNRPWVITEKIDGTNSAVFIEKVEESTVAEVAPVTYVHVTDADDPENNGLYDVYAQSRNRLITPANDNFGFAAWVERHAETLVKGLGPGRHFGEWAGPGVQKNPHALEQRLFFLFNTEKWGDIFDEAWDELRAVGVRTVPVLGRVASLLQDGGGEVQKWLRSLRLHGSFATEAERGSLAARDESKAEGIILYSTAARQAFKITLENDELPKALA